MQVLGVFFSLLNPIFTTEIEAEGRTYFLFKNKLNVKYIKTSVAIYSFFFHPVKGFNPKVDGASTFLILVCLNWASLLLLFKTACYFPWSVCLSSGPVLSSDSFLT